jgi:hypothetical protein
MPSLSGPSEIVSVLELPNGCSERQANQQINDREGRQAGGRTDGSETGRLKDRERLALWAQQPRPRRLKPDRHTDR